MLINAAAIVSEMTLYVILQPVYVRMGVNLIGIIPHANMDVHSLRHTVPNVPSLRIISIILKLPVAMSVIVGFTNPYLKSFAHDVKIVYMMNVMAVQDVV